MPDTFGGRLREHREQRQVPLTAIAEATKISITLLEGLERDDVSRWPGGIFRRAFVRAYAGAVGLNADAVVREFQETYPDPVEGLPLMGAEDYGNTGAADDLSAGFWRVLGTSLRAVTRSRSSNGNGVTPAARDRSATPAPPHAATSSLRDRRTSSSQDSRISPSHDMATSASHDTGTSASEILPSSSPEISTAPPREVAFSPADETASPPAAQTAAAASKASGQNRSPITTGASDEIAPARDINWAEAAALCTHLAHAHGEMDPSPLLAAASRLLGANGIILWIWEAEIGALRPALVHGYSTHVIAQLPLVRPDDDNATAVAYQDGRACIVSGGGGMNGAMALPVFGPAGCDGVLALELANSAEHCESVQALATILAAQMRGLVEAARTGHVVVAAERKRA